MKKSVIIMFLFFCTMLSAQTKNNIYVEAFGNGVAYTINFEREIIHNFNLRTGYGNYIARTIPVMLNYHHYLKNGHSFMVGIGAVNVRWNDEFLSLLLNNIKSDKWVTTMAFAYNIKMNTPGFNIRFAFTPFITQKGFIPFGGICLGFAF